MGQSKTSKMLTTITSTLPVTFVDIVRSRASQDGEKLAYTFLVDGDTQELNLAFQELDLNARAVAALLQSQGVGVGERALLLFPPSLDYIVALLGCMYAGVVAVPAYPPRGKRHVSRLQAIVTDAGATLTLTNSQVFTAVQNVLEDVPEMKAIDWLVTDGLDLSQADLWEAPELTSDTLALLQYTSGSTSTPKGVMLTHRNLLQNQRMIEVAFEHSDKSTFVGWLPMFHDMGLMGNVLQPLYIGARSILMSPISFLKQPARWLRAISKYQARTSGAPNFAFDMCVTKIPPEQRATLDLSSWSLAFCGAEPIHPATLERFVNAFAPCGLRRESFYPCYGLAEATLLVSGGTKSDLPVVRSFEAGALEQGRAIVSGDDGKAVRSLVGCGRSWLDQEIIIVDPDSCQECPSDQIGEVWVSGPNVGHGYWNRSAETEAAFRACLADTKQGAFLRTGDLGFFQEGELFITGRLKDLIIIRGRNHAPQDIEYTVQQSHSVLRPDCGAAVSMDVDGEERLVVVQEVTREYRQADLDEVMEVIREAVAAEHDVQVHAVVLVKPGSIPRTTSGKIQRRATRGLYLEQKLAAVAVGRLEEGSPDERAGEHRPSATPRTASLLRKALAALDEQQRHELLQSHLCDHLARSLRLDPSRMDAQKPLGRLGLDSLKAVQLQHEIETELGLTVPMADVLIAPSISQLTSQLLAQLLDQSAAPPVTRPLRSQAMSQRTLSRGQEALWYLQQLSPQSAAYNIAHAFRLETGVDPAKLRLAFQMLIDRHPGLRTSYKVRDGKPVPNVRARQDVCFEMIAARDWDDSRLQSFLVEQSHRPFDLESGPLFRAFLLARSAGEHILLVCVHHIVIDFWSLVVLMEELGAIYSATDPETAATNLPAPASYAEFVHWQDDMLSSAAGQEHESYWLQQLSGQLPTLQLPVDRVRPAVQTHQGDSHRFRLDDGLTRSLRELGQHEGATLYTVLLTVFQTLLHRYSGQTDVLIGSPVAGRSRAGFDQVVGYFANLVVMRGDLTGDPSFSELLARTRQTTVEALRHQDFPFSLLVDRLEPTRDPSRSPIFQSVFVLEKPHVHEELAELVLAETGVAIELGGLRLESLALEQRVSQFDLTFMMVEAGEGLSASIQYNSDLFDAATIARMAAHFEALARGIVEDSHRPISQLPLLPDGEEQLLTEWSGAADQPFPKATLQELFEQRSGAGPDAVAVSYTDQHLTYRVLNSRANQLARHLSKHGIAAETPVGICLDRSVEMIVAMLGVLKAGAAYVPLQPKDPPQRLAFMLQDSRVPLVITTASTAGRLPIDRQQLVLLDTDWPQIAEQCDENLARTATAENLAYVIYTSGSTGTPKGTAVSHQNVTRLMAATDDWFEFSGQDVWTLFHAHTFDFSVWEIWGSLLSGGRLVVVPFEVSRSPELFCQLLHREAVTVLNQTPSAFRQLMAEEGRQATAALALEHVIFGGEALDIEGLKSWMDRHPAAPRLVNMYGITETTVHVTYRPITAEDVGSRTLGSAIGCRIPDLQLYLLDQGFNRVPIGVAGEILVGGAGLARGYVNRPDLTAERFIPAPFSSEATGTRLYRSGDQARYLPHGDLEYLGRIDQQVKIRGFRIELGEIEAVLNQHPAVRDAAVIGREDKPGEKRLVAYVVPSAETAPQTSALRSYLIERLPDYMVPATFVTLERLPLTTNGKVDRRALPVPQSMRPQLEQDYLAPSNSIEQALARIWSELLDVGDVGVCDNFFELGGDSILAVQIAARARQAGLRLAPHELFKFPTIGDLARQADASGERPTDDVLSRDQPSPSDLLPLSPMQQGLHFHTRYAPDSGVYFEQFCCHIRGVFKAAAFQRAWHNLIERHSVFRTSFPWEGLDQPVQAVSAEVELDYSHEDWRGMSPDDQQQRLMTFLETDRRRGFDLCQAPLMRLAVIQLDDESHQFVWSVHHLLLDGWSTALALREVGTTYEAYCRDEIPDLPRPSDYADYIAWITRQDLSAAELVWREALRGFTAPTSVGLARLPDGEPARKAARKAASKAASKADSAASYGECTARIPTQETAALRSFAKQNHLTLNTIVQGAWGLLLSRYSGCDDVVFGATVSGRRPDVVGVESMIGLLINTVPVRMRISAEQALVAWLDEQQVTFSERLEFDYCPLVQIQQWSEVPSHEPLFESLLVFENFPRDDLAAGVGPFDVSHGRHFGTRTNYPLTVVVEPHEELSVRIVYDCRRFDAGSVRRLLDHFQQMLNSFVDDPARPLDELPLLARQEIAIASTFTAEPIQESLSFWMRRLDVPTRIGFGPYGQVFQQLLDPASALRRPRKGTNAILIRLEDWRDAESVRDSRPTAATDTFEDVARNVRDLIAALQAMAASSRVASVVCLCPPSPELAADAHWMDFSQETERLLRRELEGTRGVCVVTADEIARDYPVDDYFDRHSDQLGHVPYTPQFFAALGTVIVRHNVAANSAPYKVIVLDCDQTLWRGVCGEDGPEGIQIDAPREALQDFMIAQHEEGKLLCLASKNSEDDVMDVFQRCRQMRLRPEHLVSHRINWQAKSENIKSLANELQLGLDSFIYLDDNPVECAEVRAHCPDVLTLKIPDEAARIPAFLRHVWAFDSSAATEEDKQRTVFYQQNVPRDRLRQDSLTFEEFLAGLELRVDIRPALPQQLDRVAQLTGRTNQFNTAPREQTESEIANLCQSAERECLTVEVSDRFGDYGLVGVILFTSASDSLAVDTFLLSCRALGRGVEHQMLAHLRAIARERRLGQVEILFLRTTKNQPALDFLQGFGIAPQDSPSGGLRFCYPADEDTASTQQAAGQHSEPASLSGTPVATHSLSESPAASTSEPPDSTATVNGSWRSARLRQISDELCDVPRILHAIESESRLRSRSILEQPYAAPETETERLLANLWERLLAVDQVGIHDNFFGLGGHSLLATQAVSRMRDLFSVDLPLRSLFDSPTVAGMAESIDQQTIDRASDTTLRIERVDRTENLPASFAQERLWFLHQLQPNNPFYNMPAAVRLLGDLDVAALERTLGDIIERHEALRTTFASDHLQPRQSIGQQAAPELRVVDLRRLAEPRRQEIAHRLSEQEALRPFNLSQGPLLRATLLRLAEQEQVLLFTIHHIVCDGWSMGVLIQEVAAHYAGHCTGQPVSLPEVPIQYADFAVWQRRWLQGEELERQLSYWKHQLEGLPTLALPTDRPRPAIQTYRGARQELLLPEPLCEQLETLGRSEDVTLFMTLLAAFKVLLSRYTGQEDVVVGSPIAGRNREQIEGLIGFFVNSLVMRTDFAGDPRFRELLVRVRETALQAYAHQDLPFEKLVEELHPDRDLSRNPLFQVSFALQNVPLEELQLPGLTLRHLDVQQGTTQFDLALSIQPTETGLLAALTYNTELFESATIERMLGHFETLLAGIVADPGRSLSQLPLLSQSQRRQLLVEWNDTPPEEPRDTSIQQRFEAQVEKTPDAVAMSWQEERVSYRELNARASQLARYLRTLGVGPEVLVGVCLDPSLEMMVSILGVLKAGGAYLPLDPQYPKHRREFILQDSQTRLLLTEQRFVADLSPDTVQPICLDTGSQNTAWHDIAQQPTANPPCQTKPDNLAYVIYTSGSTGAPKGTGVTHHNVTRLLAATEDWYHFDGDDVWPLFHSYAFDFSVWEMWGALLYGGRLEVVPFDVTRSPQLFHQLLLRERVTVLNQTPAAFRQLMAEDSRHEEASLALRVIIFGGESLDIGGLKSWLDRRPSGPRLINMYGITETTVHVTYREITAADVARPSVGSAIGRRIPDLQIYLLDRGLEPVPLGVAGEIHVGGAGLARGYVNRPDLTAERFIPHAFSDDVAGARLYRSGDQACSLGQQDLEYLGRIDQQVKIRGFRIELGEIETVLTAHPEVRETVVVAREEEAGDKRLVAYVVTEQEMTSLTSDLRSFVTGRLPDYMVPSAFVPLASLPLTSQGKIDRHALPAPDESRPELGHAYVAPRNQYEELLADIWSRVLGVERIGVDDNFFQLGGHSLLATQVVSRVRDAFDVDLPLHDIFQRPTVEKLAEQLERAIGSGANLPSRPLARVNRDQDLPPSFAQERLWFSRSIGADR